jgi:hypothetical protein
LLVIAMAVEQGSSIWIMAAELGKRGAVISGFDTVHKHVSTEGAN